MISIEVGNIFRLKNAGVIGAKCVRNIVRIPYSYTILLDTVGNVKVVFAFAPHIDVNFSFV